MCIPSILESPMMQQWQWNSLLHNFRHAKTPMDNFTALPPPFSIANLHMLNIFAQDFCIWQHLGSNRSDMQLQHLTTIPSIPVHKIYQHLLNNTIPVMPFNTESTGNTDSIWTLFTHLGIYVSAIGSLIPVGIGLFCCYFFWCQPARLVHWHLQPGNMWYTIVDDNVEVAPIYRCDGKEPQPKRPCENHGLAIEHLPTWPESRCKQQSKSFAVPVQRSLDKSSKIQGMQKCMQLLLQDLGLTLHTTSTN